MIRKGQQIHFKPEFQDPGDADFVFIACEDWCPGDGGSIHVEVQLGWQWNPVQTVRPETIVESGA